MPAERAPWASLLRQLDAMAPAIGVWKNADEALDGYGDVDYFAPTGLWPEIADAFRSWSETHGYEYLPPCPHKPWTMYLLAVDRERGRLMQLDVRDRLTLAGAEIIDANGLGRLLEATPDGFKTLRRGAQATVKLLTKCIDGQGRLDRGCLDDESVTSGIHADPVGALEAVQRLRHGRPAVNRLVASIAAGRPDPAEARSLLRRLRAASLLRPGTLAAIAAHRLRKRTCPTLKWILSEGQRLPERPDDWIGEVREAHGDGDPWPTHVAERNGRRRRGMYLVVVGPDGVGKTTLREAITERLSTQHTVWSGRLSGPLTEFRQNRVGNGGPGAEASATVGSGLKTPYLFLDGVVRWLTWTRPWLSRGGWVITERGWWDIAVYPARYRMREVGRLHRILGLLGPRPDLILVLEAGADTVRARKDELSLDELRRQTNAWRSVIPPGQPHVYLDATLPPETLVGLALDAVEGFRSRSAASSAPS